MGIVCRSADNVGSKKKSDVQELFFKIGDRHRTGPANIKTSKIEKVKCCFRSRADWRTLSGPDSSFKKLKSNLNVKI